MNVPMPKVGLLKPMSRSMCMTLPSGSGTVENRVLLADQPTGALRNFLIDHYASDDQIEEAFNDAGGSIIARCTHGREPRAIRFVRDDEGHPALHLHDAAPTSTVEVRVLLAESVRA